MKYAIIVGDNDGYRTHTGDVDNIELPDPAEIYEDADKFEGRLDELSGA